MKKIITILTITLLVFSLVALSKTPFSHTNLPLSGYTMDNGTTAHYLSYAMLEMGYLAPEVEGLWRPYSTWIPTIYVADLWVCHLGSPSHAVYSDFWFNEFGVEGLYRPGNSGWPSGLLPLSENDTWASYTDDAVIEQQGQIGLWVGRQTAMWNDSLDADYFLTSYWVKNITTSTLSNLYIGRYCDFDFIGEGESYMENISGSDFATRTVWMRNRQNNPSVWAGMRGLNFTVSGVKCSIGYDGPSDGYEAWIINQLTTGSWPGESGPNDWHIMPICSPFTLAPNETKGFTFATAFGSSYADMMANLNRAKYRYDGSATMVEPTSLGRIKTLYR